MGSLRHRLGANIALIYLGFSIAGWPILNGTFSPDTPGYLEIELSAYRQPMYGLWADSTFALADSWRAVQFIQASAFVAFGMWVILELASISASGILAAALFAAALIILNQFGLIGLAGSLISEGLFYPMIMLMTALFLWWLRTRRVGILAGLALVLVAMTQLRTAAMLVLIVPLTAAIYMLIPAPSRGGLDRSAMGLILGLAIGVVFLPPLLGKSILQLGTAGDRTGFVLLPRVSLLPVPRSVAERSADWATMASSWRKAAAPLDAVALTQFDGQLQEQIRYHLAPRMLLPALLHRTPAEIQAGWQKGAYNDDAERIAIKWISQEWPTYLRISAFHLWGMLTMANFMDTPERVSVWAALNAVSPSTWRDAPMRTDYPLNRIDKPLKWSTELLYRLIRYGCAVLVILGMLSAAVVIRQSRNNRPVSAGCLALALAVGWAVAHGIPAALAVFPEFRYTYANLIVMISGGAAWLAYMRTPPRFVVSRAEDA
jgi:hypothetical protein